MADSFKYDRRIVCGLLGMNIQSEDNSNVEMKSEKVNVESGKHTVGSERWKTISATMR